MSVADHSAVWQDCIVRFLSDAANPLIVVLGPTASGKTDFSLDLASFVAEDRDLPLRRVAEIINADSRQLYRFMNIGTAKITPEETACVSHHLLDVLDPKEEVTAAWYKTEATRVINDILKRGNIPILVGGSMLYISALIDGLEFVTGADPVLRKKLEQQYDVDGGVELYARLMEEDPETASAFSVNNRPYVIRAMEILEGTGMKPSNAKQSGSCPWELLIFGMHWSREALVSRINMRTKKMFEQGWIDEVRSLIDKGYSTNDPGMKSHGYREIASAIFQCCQKKDVETACMPSQQTKDLEEMIAAKTRQYAKRQMTWWKGDPRIQWFSGVDM